MNVFKMKRAPMFLTLLSSTCPCVLSPPLLVLHQHPPLWMFCPIQRSHDIIPSRQSVMHPEQYSTIESVVCCWPFISRLTSIVKSSNLSSSNSTHHLQTSQLTHNSDTWYVMATRSIFSRIEAQLKLRETNCFSRSLSCTDGSNPISPLWDKRDNEQAFYCTII